MRPSAVRLDYRLVGCTSNKRIKGNEMKKLIVLLMIVAFCFSSCGVIAPIIDSITGGTTENPDNNPSGDVNNDPAPKPCEHEVTKIDGVIPATCTTEGYTGDRVCSDCGITLRTGVATGKSAHAYVGGICSECGAEDNGSGDVTESCQHSETVVKDEIPATCTTEGYSGNEVCVICGITVRLGTETAKALHTNVNGTCSACGAVLACSTHTDVNNDGFCDDCSEYVIVIIDFYAINDLHGKIKSGSTQPGIAPLTTYLKTNMTANTVLLSSGDMWQGSSESNLTYGALITEWMNELGFVSMTLGNHEYDWGESYISANAELAEFPILGINVYDSETNQRADYASPSVVISRGGIEIGIIGAIGDCYSSISGAVSDGFYFKTGTELGNLVKAESERLRADGVDFIVYSLHDDDYSYQSVLSSGYVDLVFEAHTHQAYATSDNGGVYHLQGSGENKGLSYSLVSINSANGKHKVEEAKVVNSSVYASYASDPIVDQLLAKYADQINGAYEVLGKNARYRDDSVVEQLVADLYYQYGIEKWGDKYDIVLGGGFVRTRNPYNLAAGQITYADVYSLLPFDNELVLCTIKGSDLKSKFINTTNKDYYICSGNYDLSKIENNKTYYIVTDTYTSTYDYNNCTHVEVATDGIFARDLVADFIRKGGWA